MILNQQHAIDSVPVFTIKKYLFVKIYFSKCVSNYLKQVDFVYIKCINNHKEKKVPLNAHSKV